MGYHIKTTNEQEQRLRAAVGTPANPATDVAVRNKIVQLVYRFLVEQEGKDAVKAAKSAVAQANVAAALLHQQESDLKTAADAALQAAIDARDNAGSAVPGPDWNQ